MGRAYPLLKRMSHVNIILEDKGESKKKKPKKSQAKTVSKTKTETKVKTPKSKEKIEDSASVKPEITTKPKFQDLKQSSKQKSQGSGFMKKLFRRKSI